MSYIPSEHSWISCITLLRRTLLPCFIVYFHLPNGTVCTGDVRVALSTKLSLSITLFAKRQCLTFCLSSEQASPSSVHFAGKITTLGSSRRGRDGNLKHQSSSVNPRNAARLAMQRKFTSANYNGCKITIFIHSFGLSWKAFLLSPFLIHFLSLYSIN